MAFEMYSNANNTRLHLIQKKKSDPIHTETWPILNIKIINFITPELTRLS